MQAANSISFPGKITGSYEPTLHIDFSSQRVVVIIPAYNEERFIGSAVLKTLEFPVEIIVVDDGSRDHTAEIAGRAGATVVRLPLNQGKGGALNAGFKKARELDPDVIVLMDADGQHLAEELPKLVGPVMAGKADIVVGSRYLSQFTNTPRGRVLGHSVINLATGLLAGVFVSDSQSGFRAFSRKAFEHAIFSSNGFSVESEMQFFAHANQLKLLEIPITIRYLDRPKRSAIRQGMSVLNGILKLVGQYRPLLFFGVSGFLLLLYGIYWGVIVMERFQATSQLAVGYGLICVLLSIMGMILMTTGFMLHSIRSLMLEQLKSYTAQVATHAQVEGHDPD